MRVLGVLLIGLTTFLCARTSAASPKTHAGVLCAGSGGERTLFGSSPSGATNLDSVARRLVCGGVTTGSISAVSVVAYDHGQAAGDDVRCTVFINNLAGRTFFSTTISTSGSAFTPMSIGTTIPPLAAAPLLVLDCTMPAFFPKSGASSLVSFTITDSSP